MTREEISWIPFMKIDVSGELFVDYYNLGELGHLVAHACPSVCEGPTARTLVVDRLDYPNATLLKVKGKPNSEHSGYGFSIESIERVDLPDAALESCKSVLIENSEELSQVDYTKLCGTNAKIYFARGDILEAVNQDITPIIDYQGKYLHFIYEGPEVWENIAVHSPRIDCVYSLETRGVDRLIAYVYGHVEELAH